MPTFHFDPVINPISAYKTEKLKGLTDNNEITDEDLEEFEVPLGIEPLLNEEQGDNDSIKNAIELLWAPEPFNQRTGKTRRNFDIPIVASWFKERCP